jgi:hypothetical protein
MKIVFLIIAHKEFDILKQLVDSLNHPNIDLIIHFDEKSDIDIAMFSSTISKNENLYYLDSRISINWGGFGLLEAQIRLLQIALENGEYEYFSFISGQDLLIKPIDYILDYFKRNRGHEFVEHFELPNSKKWSGNGGYDRVNYSWYVDELGLGAACKLYQLQKYSGKTNSFPNSMKLYGGSNWMTLSKNCANFIISFINSNESFYNFFRLSLLPEEMCLQTIIANSSFKSSLINTNLRYIDWESQGPKPKIMGTEDYQKLALSESHFARKFDSNVDNSVIDMVKALSNISLY